MHPPENRAMRVRIAGSELPPAFGRAGWCTALTAASLTRLATVMSFAAPPSDRSKCFAVFRSLMAQPIDFKIQNQLPFRAEQRLKMPKGMCTATWKCECCIAKSNSLIGFDARLAQCSAKPPESGALSVIF
jgi:hypothetical protein